jgi:hypothetical protein
MLLLSDVVAPAHICAGAPEITGVAFTVTGAIVLQPMSVVYVTDVTPEVIPDNTPDKEPIVAILTLPELQVPAAVTSVRVVILPAQIAADPDIDAGNALTVNTCTSLQPVAS